MMSNNQNLRLMNLLEPTKANSSPKWLDYRHLLPMPFSVQVSFDNLPYICVPFAPIIY